MNEAAVVKGFIDGISIKDISVREHITIDKVEEILVSKGYRVDDDWHLYDEISYWIFQKGDIERWCSWPKYKPIVAKEHPELIAAIDAVKIADATLKAILKGLED